MNSHNLFLKCLVVAVLVHLLVLFVFIFQLPTQKPPFRPNITFWGSILSDRDFLFQHTPNHIRWGSRYENLPFTLSLQDLDRKIPVDISEKPLYSISNQDQIKQLKKSTLFDFAKEIERARAQLTTSPKQKGKNQQPMKEVLPYKPLSMEEL